MAQNTTVPASPKPSGLTDDEIMLEAARTLSAQGQRKKAIAFYQESCRRLPDRADVYREMAVLLLSESLSAWLPWDKSRLARAAASAAGQAQHLGDTNGDCWFIVAEAGGMLGIGTSNVPVVLQEALAKYDEQMGRGEAVSAFYLGTVLRLAQIKEASGHWQDAVGLYAIMAGAAELEQSGKVRRGSFTAEQVEHAHADIARINARLNKKEHR